MPWCRGRLLAGMRPQPSTNPVCPCRLCRSVEGRPHIADIGEPPFQGGEFPSLHSFPIREHHCLSRILRVRQPVYLHQLPCASAAILEHSSLQEPTATERNH